MKKTTDQIVTVHRLISKAKLGKMEDAEKFALIKIARQFKKVAVDFDDFLKDVQERLKPEGFDAIVSKIQAGKELTPEESAKHNKYQKDITECLNDEVEKVNVLDFTPLSEEALGRFFASNDFSLSEILIISETIGG